MPARGNEKPDAEGTVKAVQKRFATPVPQVADLDELNRFLRRQCEGERERVVHSLFGPFTIKDRLTEDLAAATPLPTHWFDPCVIRPAVVVDKYQTVAFDNNRYSVPRSIRISDGCRARLCRPRCDHGTRPDRGDAHTMFTKARDDP